MLCLAQSMEAKVAMMDAGLFQGWIAAFDRYESAKRRYDAAGQIGHGALSDYLRGRVEDASRELNAATKALKDA